MGEAQNDPAPSPGTVRVSVHGPGASIDAAIEAGQAMKKLLYAVGEELGVGRGRLRWEVASVSFKCDGCGLRLRLPDRPGPGEGWTHLGGDDFCPGCTSKQTLPGDASDG